MADDQSQGGQPQGGGGLLGTDPQLLLNLGLGLMSGAAYGSNAGEGLMRGMQSYYGQKEVKQKLQLGQQQLGMNQLNMQLMQQTMPAKLDWLKAFGQRLHLANNDPNLTQQLQSQAPGLLSDPNQTPQASASGGLLNGPTASAPQTGTPPMPVPMPVPQGALPQVQRPQLPMQQAPQAQLPQQMPAPQQPGRAPFDDMDLATMGAVLGMPGTNELMDRAKAQLQYDPRLATQMETAKSPITVDQSQIQAAASRGDYQMAAMLQQKLAKDSSALDVNRNSRQWFDPSIGQFCPKSLPQVARARSGFRDRSSECSPVDSLATRPWSPLDTPSAPYGRRRSTPLTMPRFCRQPISPACVA